MCQIEDAVISCLTEDGLKIEITDTHYIISLDDQEPSKILKNELLAFAEGFYVGKGLSRI